MRYRIFCVPLLALVFAITGMPSFHFDASNGLSFSIGSEAEAKSRSSSSRSFSKPKTYKKKATKPKKPKVVQQPSTAPKKPKAASVAKKKPVAAPTKPGKRMELGGDKPPNRKQAKRAPKSAMADGVTKAKSSAAYQQRQAKLTQTRTTNPVAKNLGAKPTSTTIIRERRVTYYNSNRSGAQAAQRHEGYSRGNDYGGFSDAFLMASLMSGDTSNTGLMMYAMSGNPWFLVFMQDSREAAESSNDMELLARIDALEAENARMKATGVVAQPIDATLAAMGVPAEVALSEEVLTGEAKIAMNICSGSVGGNYYPTGVTIGRVLANGFAVSTLDTAGSRYNLDGLKSGDCDAGFVQNNLLVTTNTSFAYSASVYGEAVYFLVNAQSGIKDLEDVDPGSMTLLAGPEGSGTYAGMVDLVQIEYDNSMFSSLKHLRGAFDNASYDDMAAAVAEDPKTVGFYIASSNSNWMKQVDKQYAGKVCLVRVTDKDLNDAVDDQGNSIFTKSELSASIYPNLLCGSSSITTMAVPATFNISPVWVAQNGEAAAQAVMTGLGYLYAN